MMIPGRLKERELIIIKNSWRVSKTLCCCCNYLQITHLPSNVRQTGGIVGNVRKHQSLLVVVFTEYFVVAQIEPVAYTKPEEKVRRTNLTLKLLPFRKHTPPTCGCTVDRRSIPSGRHSILHASPSQKQVSLCYRPHSSPWCRIT